MSANTSPTIERVYTKVKPGEQRASDLMFWRSQPYEARLAALENIRREHHLQTHGDVEPRVQKVCRIVKL